MKTLKIIMLIAGILAFGMGTYNIIFLGLPNQWFGFIGGGFLFWISCQWMQFHIWKKC